MSCSTSQQFRRYRRVMWLETFAAYIEDVVLGKVAELDAVALADLNLVASTRLGGRRCSEEEKDRPGELHCVVGICATQLRMIYYSESCRKLKVGAS